MSAPTQLHFMRRSSRLAGSAADQAVFAAGNLAVGLILARRLTHEEFGAFAVAQSVFIAMALFHQSAVLEPMVVHGAPLTRDERPGFIRDMLAVNGLFLLALAAALSAGLALFGSPASPGGSAMIAYAAAAPFILTSWTLRRMICLWSSPWRSVVNQAVWLISTLGLMHLLFQAKGASVLTGIVSIGVGACVAVAAAWPEIGRLTLGSGSLSGSGVLKQALELIGYARWSAMTGFLGWLAVSSVYFSTSSIAGAEASARLKFLAYMIAPAMNAQTALNLVCLPFLVRSHRSGPAARAANGAKFILVRAVYVVPPVLNAAGILLFADSVNRFVSGEKYLFDRSAYAAISVYALISACGAAAATELRSMRHPKWVFAGYGLAAAVSYLAAGPLISRSGYLGAVQTWSVSIMCMAVFCTVSAIWLRRRSDRPAAASCGPEPGAVIS
jgi:O-antigen/teichoic acid export membrane protein